MERNYHKPSPSETIVIIGDNFIVDHLYNNFKRYSKNKIYKSDSIFKVENKIDYIIECSFNEKSQNDVLKYAIENNLKKVILLNHWKKPINEFNGLTIVQAVVPDVYGQEHISFSRPGTGNNPDSPISYCSLICEGIRRIHDAKNNFIPNIYITYGEDNIKCLYVENLYEPIEFMINEIHETSEYEIYDEYRNASVILDIIKDIIDYKGNIIFENMKTVYNKSVKRLPYQHDHKPLGHNLKEIYRYLIYNNERFMLL